ncbi:glycosyltransferase family 2 protein [Methanococcoides burtonii]|uniref:Glycosyl transferase, family 2 n=1 Tax=Methanococcoides burtonii (strain DSM 6242 / NBRC 107633 / OCM 468 / ACE-M) TaxID=259564 RepID=Q12TY4_METBU|nr:glycosyltransferase [Methanococcoides burtonii]ABE53092.1 glycosyl transferase, family 2 [Methanococcoides burtonii DSM 6242]
MSEKESVKISVVMPAYNAEAYLKDSIESILDQTYTDFEFIIVDDASTDNSHEIIEEYSKKDKRIVVLRNEINLGIAETRTKGTKYSKGKYIAVSDADDISILTRLEKQYNYLEEHKDCGVVGGFIELFDSDTSKIIGVRKYYEDDANLRKRLFLYCPVAQPVCMMRKEVFETLGYYDPKYPPAEDLDLWFRIGTKYKFANIQEILLKYRVHKKSATISTTKKMEAMTLKIRKKYSHGYGYSMTLFDKVYNLSIRTTKFVPYNIKIWVFNFIRDE